MTLTSSTFGYSGVLGNRLVWWVEERSLQILKVQIANFVFVFKKFESVDLWGQRPSRPLESLGHQSIGVSHPSRPHLRQGTFR